MSTHAGPPQSASFTSVFFKALAAATVLFVAVMLLLPGLSSGPVPRRTQCKNNLKQIALALHLYHDKYGCFPPAYTADRHGRPMHSWRVFLLPFLEFKPLYDDYRFDEPWNGPHNRQLAALNLDLFRCPAGNSPESETNYLVVVGPKTVFPGAKCTKIAEISGGTSSTILVAEVANTGLKWSEPRDLSDVEAARGVNLKSGRSISSHHVGGALCAFADGSVRFLPDSTEPESLRAFLDCAATVKPEPPSN
jgi:uncharacterized protein DUF1559